MEPRDKERLENLERAELMAMVLDKRVSPVEKSIKTLNREMGQVLGELRWIRWLLMALLGASVVSYFA